MSYAGLEQLQYIAGVGPGAKDRGRPTFAKLCRETQVLAHCAGRCASNSPLGFVSRTSLLKFRANAVSRGTERTGGARSPVLTILWEGNPC
jgi:hypothetical protein